MNCIFSLKKSFKVVIPILWIINNTYRNKKSDFNKEINQKRLSATSKIVVYLNKILGKYATDNSISLIIQKKNIVIGKAEMDITTPILEIFDKEIKDVKLN